MRQECVYAQRDEGTTTTLVCVCTQFRTRRQKDSIILNICVCVCARIYIMKYTHWPKPFPFRWCSMYPSSSPYLYVASATTVHLVLSLTPTPLANSLSPRFYSHTLYKHTNTRSNPNRSPPLFPFVAVVAAVYFLIGFRLGS